MPSDHAAWAAHDHLAVRVEPLSAADHAAIARYLSRRAHGAVASHKNNRVIPWRNAAERDLLLLLEADPDVLSYEAMPERLHMLVDGQSRTHVPSARVRTVGGEAVLDALDTRSAPRAALADLVGRAYAERRVAYRALSPADIRLQPRFGNAMLLLGSRRFRPSRATELLVMRSLSSHDEPTVADVERDLAGEPDARATLYRMALDGLVRLDMSAVVPGDMRAELVAGRGV